MSLKYKLFVVFHNQLVLEYYDKSLINDYVFVNVNPNNPHIAEYKDFNIINQYELKKFHSLGKWYTESEVIYNVYKNPYLYEDLDYIGFLQYDIVSTPLRKNLIDPILAEHNHINFEPHLFQDDYTQNILMDIRFPNQLTGKGVNCYDAIIDDYNKYYHNCFTKDILYDKQINLCSSFVLSKGLFVEMMQFISGVIESGKLNKFDVNHNYRIQGGFLERYYAVWLVLKETQPYILKLIHLYEESNQQNKSLKLRIIQAMKRILR